MIQPAAEISRVSASGNSRDPAGANVFMDN